MENYIQVKCSKGCASYTSYAHPPNDPDEEDLICVECGSENIIHEFKNMTDVDTILEIAGEELENANYHSITDLPVDIWEAIKSYIPADKQPDVARGIAKAFHNSI